MRLLPSCVPPVILYAPIRLASDNLKKVLPTYDEVARFARATTRLRELLVLLPNKSIPVVDLVIKCKQVAL